VANLSNKTNISKHIKAIHSVESRPKRGKVNEKWVTNAINATLKDYVVPIENDVKHSYDTVSFLNIINDECLEIIEKDLEEHKALKVNLTLTSMFQQPTSDEEMKFHVASGTLTILKGDELREKIDQVFSNLASQQEQRATRKSGWSLSQTFTYGENHNEQIATLLNFNLY